MRRPRGQYQLCKVLAKQTGTEGIRVNGVARGYMAALQVSGVDTMEKLKNFGGDTPLADQDNLLNCVPFMCNGSKRFQFTTGQVMESLVVTDNLNLLVN